MAREEIKLVGSFKDDITPQLKKLNKEIASIGRTFTKFNKKLAPVTKSFAKMAMSAKEFSNAMKTQRQSIDSSARAMREYSRQAGKMSGALRKVTDQRMKAQRQMGMSRAEMRRSGGGGAVAPIPSAPKATAGVGAKFGTSAGGAFKQSIGATAIGTTIGMMASQMIMGAANKIGSMLAAPFQKFGAMFAERIGDEMDDIKSAGGLFALDMDLTQQSGNERFFKNYNEALRYQEKLNIDMAQSAASLPGVTSQYVATSRQLTDTIQMVMEKDRDKFNVMAQKFGANVSGGGVDASKEALRTVLQKQTEQVMLQSQGQQGGLPMHIMIQQLLGKEAKGGKLGIQAFTNRFRAAFQKNPLLKNFLLRAEDEMAKTEAGSVERLQLLMETFDRAMPKEVINKMRGSISGMQEALRSGLLDPQAGLFGMSRANIDPKTGKELMKKNVDDLGNVLFKVTQDIFPKDAEIQKVLKDKGIEKGLEDSLKGLEFTAQEFRDMGFDVDELTGVVSKNKKAFGKFSESNTYIFEQIREILAGYGPVLLEFVGFLPSLFDPFGEMTKNLMSFRDKSQAFINKFNNNLQQFEDVANKYALMEDPEKQGLGSLLKKQSRSRAAFGTMAKFLEGIGGIDANLSKRIQDVAGATSEAGIQAVEAGELNKLFVPLFQSLINSDLMKEFGKIGGIIIGGITKAVIQMIQGLTTFAKGKGTNKLMEGFIEGITTAFGDMSFNEAKGIITDAIVSVVSKGLDLLFTQVIPNLVSMYIGGLFQGLFSGSPITMILSALGIVKIGAMLVTAVSSIGTIISFVGGIFTTLAGIVSFVTTNFALLSGIVGTVVVAVVAPILAVAGAVMLVIAVVRNFGSILKMAGGAIKMIVGEVITATSRYIGALGNILSWIPGLKGIGEGLKKAGQGMLEFGDGLKDQGFTDIKEAGAEMKRQFTEDAAAIKAKFTGMFPAMDSTTMSLSQMNAMIGENVNSIKAEEQARKDAQKAVTAFSLQSADTKTQGTEYTGSTYTAGGIEYDAATGLPVSSITGGAMYTGASSKPVSTQDSTAPTPTPASPATPAAPAAPAAPQLPDLSGPIEQVGQATTGVANATNAVQEVGTTMSTLTAPMKEVAAATAEAAPAMQEVGPATESATSALETFSSAIDAIPPLVEAALVGAATTAGSAITQAAQSLAQALNQAAQSIKQAASASASAPKIAGPGAGNSYDGHTGGRGAKTLPLAEAISKERSMMPSGADLMIANTSETVIPAFSGHMGDGFKGFSFEELESAAGFNRMATYTDQISEIADRTAKSFSMAGALGGGSATLNAMEALGHSFGLVTTSGHRPGDPGFHGVNRARDLSNGSGETPEMNAAASKMASEFGASLTELIYTPLGFSIKNGAKTGLISPDNHYHHIHVAVAEGLAKAAVFSSQQAAMQYERKNMPAGAEPMKVDLSSMTANSSEFGGSGGDINIDSINISGVQDPEAIANQVAEEILVAVRRSAYGELYTS